MSEKENRLLNLLTEISIELGITPPFSKDIGEWWSNGLEEISDSLLLDIKEFGLFSKSSIPKLQKMHQLSLAQIEKRQLLSTLV